MRRIWTADDASEEEMEKAYQLAKENELLTGEYRFNVKYSLAEYFIRRAAEDGSELRVSISELAERLGVKNLLLYHTEDNNLYVRNRLYTDFFGIGGFYLRIYIINLKWFFLHSIIPSRCIFPSSLDIFVRSRLR